MLGELVNLITAVPELVPLFSKLISTITSARTKEEKLALMERAALAAAARRAIRS